MCCQFEMSYYNDIIRTNLKKENPLCYSYVAIFKIPFALARLNNLIDMREGSNSSHLNDFQSVCFFKMLIFYICNARCTGL